MSMGYIDYRIATEDLLGILRHEIVKTIYINNDVEIEYFNALTNRVERNEWDSVRIMAEFDSSMAEAKVEIIGMLLDNMRDLIDEWRLKHGNTGMARYGRSNPGDTGVHQQEP